MFGTKFLALHKNAFCHGEILEYIIQMFHGKNWNSHEISESVSFCAVGGNISEKRNKCCLIFYLNTSLHLQIDSIFLNCSNREWSPVHVTWQCRVQKGTGSQVLGSWNEEARVDSSFYRVWEAAVVTVAV